MTEQELHEITMQADSLYRQEIFTDRRVGTVRKLTPVTASGEVDSARDIVFEGQASLYTPAGALPLNFEIEADDFAQAIEKFGDAAQVAMEKTIKELEEMRRNQASGIVTPG
ncbi:MAG TPA: hypothetical protein VFP95_02130, partial [Gammaproteobacteria bacterium]|nr:hypothetical protein [Gammaproteobacteria bacterium]